MSVGKVDHRDYGKRILRTIDRKQEVLRLSDLIFHNALELGNKGANRLGEGAIGWTSRSSKLFMGFQEVNKLSEEEVRLLQDDGGGNVLFLEIIYQRPIKRLYLLCKSLPDFRKMYFNYRSS